MQVYFKLVGLNKTKYARSWSFSLEVASFDQFSQVVVVERQVEHPGKKFEYCCNHDKYYQPPNLINIYDRHYQEDLLSPSTVILAPAPQHCNARTVMPRLLHHCQRYNHHHCCCHQSFHHPKRNSTPQWKQVTTAVDSSCGLGAMIVTVVCVMTGWTNFWDFFLLSLSIIFSGAGAAVSSRVLTPWWYCPRNQYWKSIWCRWNSNFEIFE